MTTEPMLDSQRYEAILQEVGEILAAPDERKLERATVLLDEAAGIADDPQEIQHLRARVEQERLSLLARREYKQAKAECEALWAQEQEYVKANTTPQLILEKVYGEARKRAESAYEKYPFPLLDGLKNDAQIQYEAARKRYQIKTTANQTHQYQKALEELTVEQDKEKEIPWYDENGQLVGKKKIREATALLTVDARQFARRKAEEYLSIARAHMEKYQPRLARDVIAKRKDLYLLPEKYEKKLVQYEEETIQPALEELEKAERLSAEAARSQDLSQAWMTLQEAIKTYPTAHAIEDARKTLLSRTLAAAETYVHNAQEQYEDFCKGGRGKNGLEEAKTALAQASSLCENAQKAQQALKESLAHFEKEIQELQTQRDVLRQRDQDDPVIKVLEDEITWREKRLAEFSDSLLSGQDDLQRLQDRETELSKKIEAALDYQEQIEKEYAALKQKFQEQPQDAHGVLKTFLETYDSEIYRARYGALALHLPDLKTLQTHILAFEDVSQVLQNWEDAFLSNDGERIAQAVQEAETLVGDEAISNAQRKEVKQVLRRLRGRLDFLQGEEARKRGDLAEAQKALRRVKDLSGHPDQVEAQKSLTKIEEQSKKEAELSAKLAEAEDLLEEHPQRVYELLTELLKEPSHFRREIVTMLERARKKWEEKLLIRLDEMMQTPSVMADELHQIVEKLAALPEPRSPSTVRKARQARALAFASDARIHEMANRLQEALAAWNEACLADPTRQEYRENQQRVRLAVAQRDLSKNPGEKETEGILLDLQKDFPNNQQVLSLIAREYYRLSHLEGIDIEQRFAYLERAESTAKEVLAEPGLPATERGRLQDLLRKIERDYHVLRQQANLERELSSRNSFSQLAEALKGVDELRKQLANDRAMQKHLERWWKEVQKRLIEELEAADSTLSQDEQKFEIRSKIALLDPDHPLARAVGPAIIRETESLLREIERVLDDYAGVQIAISKPESRDIDPRELVQLQQMQLENLRERIDMLHNLLVRFGQQAGMDSMRLKESLIDKRRKLTAWLDKVSKFNEAINQLAYELTVAGQDNNWSRFDDIRNQVINTGFGKHRAMSQLLQRKDNIQERRTRLQNLYQEVVQALQHPRGEQIFEAQEKLERLTTEDDPNDEFGFQSSLVVQIPFGGQRVLRNPREIRKWLEESISQVKAFGQWVYQSGAKHIWPSEMYPYISTEAIECADWDEVRLKVQQLHRKGQFTEAIQLLDLIISGEDASSQDSSESQRHLNGDFSKLIETYRRFLPMTIALEKLSHPPVDEKTMLPFLRDLLPALDEFRKTLQTQLDAAKEMRRQTRRRQNAWREAQFELEQSLENLRTIEMSPLRFVPLSGYKMQLARAEKRYRDARLQCQKIAPEHPLLTTLD